MAASWCLLGIGMASGLYDAAFATLTGIFGRNARGPITGITLFAGFGLPQSGGRSLRCSMLALVGGKLASSGRQYISQWDCR